MLNEQDSEIDTNQLKCFFEQMTDLYHEAIAPIDPVAYIDSEKFKSYNQEFKTAYAKEFEQGCEINVWDISGLKRDEVRNCTALAWWLDCQGSHGLGATLLQKIISDHLHGSINLNASNMIYHCRTEQLPLGDLENRIDIEIVSKDLLLFWEVKIDAPEGYKQLERYHQLLKCKGAHLPDNHKALIYLTPYKVTEEKRTTQDKTYYLTWKDIRNSLQTIANKLPNETLSKPLLQQYCTFINNF